MSSSTKKAKKKFFLSQFLPFFELLLLFPRWGFFIQFKPKKKIIENSNLQVAIGNDIGFPSKGGSTTQNNKIQ